MSLRDQTQVVILPSKTLLYKLNQSSTLNELKIMKNCLIIPVTPTEYPQLGLKMWLLTQESKFNTHLMDFIYLTGTTASKFKQHVVVIVCVRVCSQKIRCVG